MTPEDLLQRLSILLAGERTDVLQAFGDGAVATDGSADFTPAEVVDHLAALTSATILHAIHDERSLTILIESLDEVTALKARESWTFVFEAGVVRSFLPCRGGSLIQRRRALAYREVEPYLAGFGLRHPEPADEPLVRRAAEVVSTAHGHQAIFEANEVLLNEDIIYIPFCWIGCVGFLVVRATWTPILLGSGIPLRVHVWAYYRGFADGETGTDRANDLVITSIKDREATQRVLRRLGSMPDLDQLPVRIRGADLYFSREALWKAELKGDFRFHVEPSSEIPSTRSTDQGRSTTIQT